MASVSFSRKGSTSAAIDTEEDSLVHISINPMHAPYLQPSLLPPSRALSIDTDPKDKLCIVLFERASSSWWNPRFDSGILEEQYQRSTFPQISQRFQYSLIFLFVATISYCIYGVSMANTNWIAFIIVCLTFMLYTIGTLTFTLTHHYQSYHLPVSIITTLFLCLLSLSAFAMYTTQSDPAKIDLSPIGMFCICIEVLLLLYTVIPLPLYLCILIGGTYSITFEILSIIFTNENDVTFIVVRFFLHLCVHLVSIHTLLMAEVRMRNTFMKVGQSLIVRRELEIEKHIKEKMIHSVMPPKVADWLMSTQETEDDEISPNDCERRVSASPRQSQMVFRPFNMACMDDVSILFADIVGFTKMSSNKTAEQLVGLLNDLFGRFDYLCAKLGCEKISTLGDCYYCVAGCPDPRPDHAKCCVEMGLGMIKAIGEFDEDTNENVNMRVGIHTGTVLCGIVGTYRFKFDVWSNDVTLANLMESTGKPGKVHISDNTYSFLQELYNVEEGLPHKGHKTYFIRSRKPVVHEKIAALHTLCARHSWPSHPVGEVKSASSRKPSSQSEKGGNEEESTMIAVHHFPQHSSHSTVSSSRKDSGIRSRHSSLQDVILDTSSILAPHLFGHRFSGYETSSQTSIADTGRSSGSSAKGCSLLVDPNLSLNVSLARLRHLRKQSDLQLIRCVQQDAGHLDYFVRPPVNKLSLFFEDSLMEQSYRKRFHCKNLKETKLTLASATLNTYCDIFVSALFFIVIAISCVLLFNVSSAWLAIFVLGTVWQVFIGLLCVCEILVTKGRCRSPCMSKLYKFYTTWYPWHFCGAILVILPASSVYSNFSCHEVLSSPIKMQAFCFLVVVSIVHFCNFAQLNYWLKSLLACIAGTGFILLLNFSNCNFCSQTNNTMSIDHNITSELNTFESSKLHTIVNFNSNRQQYLLFEIILDVTLLVLLVWFLNREFEISYRLSFHGGILAIKDKKRIQWMKNQADWLLHNIIPRHVAEQLKSTSKYSENHKDAGIIFASIVNFNEMYDESYEGGKEYLRILNEVVGDFDELLKRPEFKNVEKIKTIGSTFMAASGLNQKLRLENSHPHTHLWELLDFAIAMEQVIERFNYNLLEFNFIIRIGYNFGDVTAGVIGTTKLYYDIWGDAVNTASRMDSTGIPGRIQIAEHCIDVLNDYYTFEPRGGIYVKGKDTMNVYLLTGKKNDENLNSVPNGDS